MKNLDHKVHEHQNQHDLSQEKISVVISGISGRFPESENLDEFWKNLHDGVDMVTDDGRRWTPGAFDLPKRSGKLKGLDKFDAGFFGVHAKQTNFMDPQLRMLMEVTHEAIIDAGVNPAEVRGTRTGVFIGASGSESEKEWLVEHEDRRHGYTLTGCSRAMFSNRISFAFDLQGPSFTVDTACSSSFIALEQALSSIKLGHCDAAIVGGAHLCLEPEMTLQFNRLNMLSPDGKCKSFDAEGNGYVRSEAVVAIFIQKKNVARRSYASILAARTNTDGFKEKGVTFPSGERQKALLEETYKEAGINPKDVVYVEAHGTGTPAGDPQELTAIAAALCKDRDESNPLLIGSVKSNMGHPEPASGLCGIAKVLLAFQNGVIPGNLHFKNPNPNITPLIDGRLKVVSQNTPWNGGIVGLNSFGFGGANVHVILKSDSNSKKRHLMIQDDNSLPFIIPFSGCSEKSVDFALKKLHADLKNKSSSVVKNTVALLHQTFQEKLQKHHFRGCTIFQKNDGNSAELTEITKQNTKKMEKPPVWFVFNGMGSQWLGFAKQLFKFSAFKHSIEKSSEILKNNQIDLINTLFSDDEKILGDVTNSFVVIAAVQIALVDLLSSLGIKPDGILGHSVGELGAAYADGCLTLEQTIMAALARGQAIAELPGDQKYGMAAVGLSWDEVKSKCPLNVYPACHNAKDSVTISGPLDDITIFVDQLKKEGIFAKEVSSSGRAFHSKHIEYAKPKLKILLDEIILFGKPRSSRWKSTSIPESDWNCDLAKTSSADYHVNNLISPVLFHEALAHVPESAVVIEIGPHCLLQAILKRSLPACCHIGLVNKNAKDISNFLCQAVGKMFNCGLNPDLSCLYSPVEFPVSCSVPSLSPLILWDHEKSWNVANFDPAKRKQDENPPGQTVFEISLAKDSDKFYADHIIDKRVLFPATGYLCLVWKAFAQTQFQNRPFDQVPVVFENFKIERATIVPENGDPVKFHVNIFSSSGEFELIEGGISIVTGIVRSPKGNEFSSVNLYEKGTRKCRESIPMNKTDAYKELRLRGYEYGEKFQGILNLDTENSTGEVKWLGNWVTLLDTILQIAVLHKSTRNLLLPSYLEKTVLDPQAFLKSLALSSDDCDDFKTVSLLHNNALTTITCQGIQFQRWKTGMAPKTKQSKISGELKLERFQFTPYFDDVESTSKKELSNSDSKTHCLRTCVEIILENIQGNTLNMAEFQDGQKSIDFSESESDSLAQSIQSLVLQQPSKLFSGKIFVNNTHEKLCKNDDCDESAKEVEKSGISIVTVQSQKALEDKTVDADLIVMTNFKEKETIQNFSAHQVSNFLLLHSEKNLNSVNISEVEKIFGVVLVAQKFSENASFFLFRKQLTHSTLKKTVIEIDLTSSQNDFNYDWVETLKNAMKSEKESKSEEERRIYVVSRNSPEFPSGALGLINCLTKEPGGQNIRCFFVQGDTKLNLDFENPCEMLSIRLQHDLVFNIFDSNTNSNVWGSYRFFPLRPQGQAVTKKVEHGFVNIVTKGDLSSFQWFESPLKYHEPQSDLCKIYYAALNFRDVMLCTGKLSLDSLPNNQGLLESVLGLEFSGKTCTGRKIVGYLPNARAFATSVIPDPGFLWDVPDSWTLAQAATASVVFSTAYYALLIRGKMRKGESILIHSGAGGVGQAAIRIALSMSCKVFTTVSNKEKREFLQKKFPQLEKSSFANSRDSSFLNHILEQTEGKGVDLVLNSLAGELLQASVKCLRQHGRFLEIGKVDLFNDSKFGMSVLLKDVSVHGILLDSLITGTAQQKELWNLMDRGIKSGVVQPLDFTTFSDSTEEIEKAFRFMASGKHMGKVLIKIHDENEESSTKLVKVLPRSYFDPVKSYIVVGGLGGFGLELCGWLVERGVKKLAIVSRSGVRNGFQDFQIRKWREVNKVEVLISTADVTTIDGASSLLKTVIEFFNSPIGGIFNLAMVLRDGLMDSQTAENFQAVSKPKVNAALALDKISRELTPSLEHFVVFTSIASGQGSMGLANYGWANSASERICEQRRKSGFPALAIMWGAVGDVGVLQEDLQMGNDAVVGGTNAQPISSCLSVLDILLHESKSPNSQILASRVIADKSLKRKSGALTTSTEEDTNLSAKVAHILGMKSEDLKNVNVNTKLYEMGMDSLMQVEVKQLFEMYAGISFNPTEMIELTFGKIMEIQKRVEGERKNGVKEFDAQIGAQAQELESEEEEMTEEKSILFDSPTNLKRKADLKRKTLSRDKERDRVNEFISEGPNDSAASQTCLDLKPVSTPQKLRKKTNSVQNLKQEQKQKLDSDSIGAYLLGVLTMLILFIFYLLSICIRQLNKLYLKFCQDSSRIKMLSRPYDQICAANPRTSNQIQCIKFSGIPQRAKILEKLEKNMINWTTNILLENGRVKKGPTSETEDSFYKPYESLSWKISSGIFFDYWEKVEDFSVSNHLSFKTCHSAEESELRKQVLQLCESYHNKKWDETKPQWEVCVLAPEYDSNYPPESKEFYIIFVSHHSYGDGFSYHDMLQYALKDGAGVRGDELKIENPRKKDLKNYEATCSFASRPKVSFLIKEYAMRLHRMILEMSRIQKISRGYDNFCRTPDSSRHCGLYKFSLSKIKAVKNQMTGKRASVNAVILTCTSRAYERIYNEKNIKVPTNLVAVMPFAHFQQKKLDMVNSFSQSYTAVPTNIPDVHERLNEIQKSIEDSSSPEKLMTSWQITGLLSALAKPIVRLMLPFINSPSLVFTSVPATVPKNSTYFGGYTLQEFFGYSMLVSKTHGAFASAIDSTNDSIILSFVIDDSALEISPNFLELFFQYFQDELDNSIVDDGSL